MFLICCFIIIENAFSTHNICRCCSEHSTRACVKFIIERSTMLVIYHQLSFPLDYYYGYPSGVDPFDPPPPIFHSVGVRNRFDDEPAGGGGGV
ncbi:hypothetical protein DERP_009231 [Dermatophagoides pteronyssinus]|uniref:Secreted protein n=1 Tax=Dermatophagoides pteronyssinus TaxID=6956 RepID=A0ABQ8JRU8_DERPT|nr:hypothetical protein DERP_009231 [Dermatophagoides pteronyssinus]